MHATIRSYSGVPGFVDQLVANEGAIQSLLRDISGFRAYYLVRTGDAEAVSVSVYDDAAGTEASTQAARDWIAANLPDFSASPPQVWAGEVAVQA